MRRTRDRGLGQDTPGNVVRMPNDGLLRVRTFALLVAAIVAITLVAGCGGGTATPKESAARDNAIDTQYKNLVAQDKVVAGATANATSRQRLVAAMRRSPRARAAIARLLRQRQARLRANNRKVVQISAISTIDVCASVGPRGGTRAQRQARNARQLQRKRALYYLNLSCGSR